MGKLSATAVKSSNALWAAWRWRQPESGHGRSALGSSLGWTRYLNGAKRREFPLSGRRLPG